MLYEVFVTVFFTSYNNIQSGVLFLYGGQSEASWWDFTIQKENWKTCDLRMNMGEKRENKYLSIINVENTMTTFMFMLIEFRVSCVPNT